MIDSIGQLEVIKEKLKNINLLRDWLVDLSSLKGRYVSKSKIAIMRRNLGVNRKLSKVIYIYDNYLWERKVLGYKINSVKLAEIDEYIGSIIKKNNEEINALFDECNEVLSNEDFRIGLSNEVSKQFTMVSIITIVALLAQRLTRDLSFDSKVVFLSNSTLITLIISIIFYRIISGVKFNKLNRYILPCCIVILVSLNIYFFHTLKGVYSFSISGLLFLSSVIAFYFSIAINSLHSYFEKNKKKFGTLRLWIIVAMILTIEILFFIALSGGNNSEQDIKENKHQVSRSI